MHEVIEDRPGADGINIVFQDATEMRHVGDLANKDWAWSLHMQTELPVRVKQFILSRFQVALIHVFNKKARAKGVAIR